MLHIAICDDEPLHLEHARQETARALADRAPQIDSFSGGDALLRQIREEGYAPDAAILDIELRQENGVDLACTLNRLVPDCRILFLTAYAEHSPEAYRAEHVWLVLKSRMEEFLGPALEKALHRPEQPGEELLLRNRGSARRVPVREVLYLSRVGRKAQVVTGAGSYFASQRPEELIPEDLRELFLRCHQGYWVKLDAITALEREEFVLSNGSRIPISRSFREQARERFFDRYRF